MITEKECLRCGHKWYPRTPLEPLVCPHCHSKVWHTPKKNIKLNLMHTRRKPEYDISDLVPGGVLKFPSPIDTKHARRVQTSIKSQARRKGWVISITWLGGWLVVGRAV